MRTDADRVLETPTARLAYDERGSGEPVVFVHSGITDRRMWDPVVERFGERYRAVRYDRPGFGGSVVTGPGTDRGDLLGVLDALGIDRAHLVGASYGAGIALDTALSHPERVRSLTLVGPAIGGHDYEEDSATWDRVESLYERSVEAFEAGDIERAAELEVRLWVVGPERDPGVVDPALRERVTAMDRAALESESRGDQREDETALDPPAVERLSELSVPVLAVVGEYDLALVHDAVARLEEAGAERVVLADSAHLPSLERPDEFDEAVSTFLAGR
jgi:pimeloyl-ACP methyl ester carboxylesterase